MPVPPAPWRTRHLGKLPVLVALVVWTGWILFMASGDRWYLFKDNWFMSVTMMVGSFVAGSTSEGGGAVAFPVMTLLFKIPPSVARDFSMMIQSFGMTAASILIIAQGIKVEWRAVRWAGLGGLFGVTFGLTFVAPYIPPSVAKLFFTSLWLAFAFALYLINRHHDRETKTEIEDFQPVHAAALFGVGILGGMVSSITGSGLDIITFSLLVLAFRMSESVGTPTSVILMAMCSMAGFFWRGAVLQSIEPQTFSYWYVCIPVVVVGAPLGARFIKNKSRLFVAGILYVTITLQFVTALFVMELTPWLVVTILATFGGGSLLFWLMARAGSQRLLEAV